MSDPLIASGMVCISFKLFNPSFTLRRYFIPSGSTDLEQIAAEIEAESALRSYSRQLWNSSTSATAERYVKWVTLNSVFLSNNLLQVIP